MPCSHAHRRGSLPRSLGSTVKARDPNSLAGKHLVDVHGAFSRAAICSPPTVRTPTPRPQTARPDFFQRGRDLIWSWADAAAMARLMRGRSAWCSWGWVLDPNPSAQTSPKRTLETTPMGGRPAHTLKNPGVDGDVAGVDEGGEFGGGLDHGSLPHGARHSSSRSILPSPGW